MLTNITNKYYIWKILVSVVCVASIVGCQNYLQSEYLNQIVEDKLAGRILWSPHDANKLLVSTSQSEFGETEIYLLDVVSGSKEILVQTEYGDIFALTWSPDGKEFIFSSLPGTSGFEQGGLWILHMDNRTIDFLQSEGNNVAWGPSRNQITFVRTQNAKKATEIVIKDLITKEEKIIYKDEEIVEIIGLSWSSKKDELAFAMRNTQISENYNIYVLGIVSQEVNQITNSGDNTYPSWSPTSDHIAYRHKYYDKNKSVFSLRIINLSDGCEINLLESNLLTSGSWSPDGTFLAFSNVEGIYTINVLDFINDNYDGTKTCN